VLLLHFEELALTLTMRLGWSGAQRTFTSKWMRAAGCTNEKGRLNPGGL
jgi:hypothetical protein